MKKTIMLLSALALAFSIMIPVKADTPKVMLNGNEMIFESDPYIENDFTMVPFRAIFEAMGATVGWDEDTRCVMGYLETADDFIDIGMQIDSTIAFVKGEKTDLDIAAEIKDDFTFVPLRFVAENLGADVLWDHDNYTVIITTK